tara:strand:+ start:90 stop:350 length:261 start_codon:yes stop_codon:yes gene_type:complete
MGSIEMIKELAEEMKPLVQEIENGVPTSKDNYDRYLGVVEALSKGNKVRELVTLIALAKAGANTNAIEAVAEMLNLECSGGFSMNS